MGTSCTQSRTDLMFVRGPLSKSWQHFHTSTLLCFAVVEEKDWDTLVGAQALLLALSSGFREPDAVLEIKPGSATCSPIKCHPYCPITPAHTTCLTPSLG